MVKNNVYIKKLRMPAYNTRLWIIVSNSLIRSIDVVEDLIDHKIMSMANRKPIRALMYAYVDPNSKYHVNIFVKPNSKPGEVAHETKHALNLIFKWHGVMLSTHNDETETYMLEWLIDKVHDAIKRYPKPKPKRKTYDRNLYKRQGQAQHNPDIEMGKTES